MDTDLDLTVRRVDSVPVLNLSGDVDEFTCAKLRDSIRNLLDEGEFNLVIGVSGVNYIDSSGLGTLVGGLRSVAEHEGGLAISGANPQIERVLSITGLNKILPLFEDDRAAVQSLKKPKSSRKKTPKRPGSSET
jgi:anti-anti-sigma factor